MAFEKRVQLAGSERNEPAAATVTGAVNPQEIVRATIILKHKSGPPKVTGSAHLSHREFEQKHGADPKAIAAVERFAANSGLQVTESSARKRRVVLSGTAEAMATAFGKAIHV